MMLLIFRNGAERTLEIVDANPDKLHIQDAVIVPWEPVNGDRNTTHYRLTDGELVYDPPPPPLPDATSPLPDQFLDSIADHPQAPVQIYQYLPYIARYADQPVRRKALWAKVIAAPPTWLTAQVIAAIEAAAEAARMPLK